MYPITDFPDFFRGKPAVLWHYDLYVDGPVDEKTTMDKCLVGDPEAKFE